MTLQRRAILAVLVVVSLLLLLLLHYSRPSLEEPRDLSTTYRVLSSKDIRTLEEYQALLNEMAFQGWQVDHVISRADLVVFRRLGGGDSRVLDLE